uniref:Globin family profile domain-containing protein n=1 Tax=Plectus sambesii TaxID=2011161 RepID=A0A914WSP1_9BILA
MSTEFRRTQSLRVPKDQQRSASLVRTKTERKISRSMLKPEEDPALCSFAKLSAHQKSVLRASWKAINNRTLGATIKRILTRLELTCPTVKEIFSKATFLGVFNRDTPAPSDSKGGGSTLNDHVKQLVKFFDELIGSLDDPVKAVADVRRVGMEHGTLKASCGFKADAWERFGEIAMEVICALDGVQKSREAPKAWRILIACATDELRSGFEEGARAVSRKSSLNTEPYLAGASAVSNINHCLRHLQLEHTNSAPYNV